MKTIIKKGRTTIGFVYKTKENTYFFAFGKPTASSYISFQCSSMDDGISRVKEYSY
jgi:hypothetical protein